MNEPKASQDSQAPQAPDSLPPVDAGLSRLYRATAGNEPPAALDAAILKAAREAVAPKPVSTLPPPWWKRLKVPVAVAATVMLTVMLTLTVDRNPPEIMLENVQKPVPKTLSPALPAPQAETRADTQATTRADDAGGVRKSMPAAPVSAPAPVPAPAAIADRAEKKSKGASVSATPEAATRPPSAMEIPAALSVTPREKMESVEGRASVSAERERNADRAPAMAPAGAAAPMLESTAKRAVPRPEIVWLDEIRALRRQGRLEEAAHRLAEFRAAYPDYPLPEDLK